MSLPLRQGPASGRPACPRVDESSPEASRLMTASLWSPWCVSRTRLTRAVDGRRQAGLGAPPRAVLHVRCEIRQAGVRALLIPHHPLAGNGYAVNKAPSVVGLTPGSAGGTRRRS